MSCQPDGITGPGGQGSGLGTDGTYPRTLTISRIAPLAAAGDVGYRSPSQSQESAILTGIAASIDFQTRGPDPLAKVPSDAVGRTLWRIFLPADAVAPGAIKRDDVGNDDLGRRFKLNEPFWGPLNVQIEAELLRA